MDKIRDTVGKVVAAVLCNDPDRIYGGIALRSYGATQQDVDMILAKLEEVYKVGFGRSESRDSITVGQLVIAIKNMRRYQKGRAR